MAKSHDLITADQARTSAFDHALHGGSTDGKGGFRAMMGKGNAARDVAMNQYFQHWDNKKAEDETDAIRQARTTDYASLTRQSVPPPKVLLFHF